MCNCRLQVFTSGSFSPQATGIQQGTAGANHSLNLFSKWRCGSFWYVGSFHILAVLVWHTLTCNALAPQICGMLSSFVEVVDTAGHLAVSGLL